MKDITHFQSPSGFPFFLSRDRRGRLHVEADESIETCDLPTAVHEETELNLLLAEFELNGSDTTDREAFKFLRTYGGAQ